jgi:enamine deaminase RidA (YjgF/YER057c/UK114 family)
MVLEENAQTTRNACLRKVTDIVDVEMVLNSTASTAKVRWVWRLEFYRQRMERIET